MHASQVLSRHVQKKQMHQKKNTRAVFVRRASLTFTESRSTLSCLRGRRSTSHTCLQDSRVQCAAPSPPALTSSSAERSRGIISQSRSRGRRAGEGLAQGKCSVHLPEGAVGRECVCGKDGRRGRSRSVQKLRGWPLTRTTRTTRTTGEVSDGRRTLGS